MKLPNEELNKKTGAPEGHVFPCKVHEKKTKLVSRWTHSTGKFDAPNGETIQRFHADVDLWYCYDCDRQFLHEWHADSYFTFENESLAKYGLEVYHG